MGLHSRFADVEFAADLGVGEAAGDGSEHLHFWFMARPARLPQTVGSFAAIWDDLLPPLPERLWRENLAAVAAALGG